MEWKTIDHINNEFEINNHGDIRNKSSKITVEPFYNLRSGFFEVDMATKGFKRTTRRNIHTIVAIYFLNNGEKVSNYSKVIFKNGDVSNYGSNNLEIVNKNHHTNYRKPKEKKELYVSYGDEIYC
jgi:hypothetical protein